MHPTDSCSRPPFIFWLVLSNRTIIYHCSPVLSSKNPAKPPENKNFFTLCFQHMSCPLPLCLFINLLCSPSRRPLTERRIFIKMTPNEPKAVKRRVRPAVHPRELRTVKRSMSGGAEDGLGASHRLRAFSAQAAPGAARYRGRVSGPWPRTR